MSETPSNFDPLWIAVGKFIAAWNDLEMSLVLLFQALTDTDQFRARIILDSIRSNQGRRELIKRLGHTYLEEESIKKLNPIMRRIANLNNLRNQLAHTTFLGDEDEKSFTLFIQSYASNNDRQWIPEFKTVRIKELEARVRAVTVLNRDIILFVMEIREKGHINSEPRIHREPPSSPDPRTWTPLSEGLHRKQP